MHTEIDAARSPCRGLSGFSLTGFPGAFSQGGFSLLLKSVLLLSIVVFLGACATLDRHDCEGGDWQEIGYRDGALGRGGEFLALHRKACLKHGVTVVEPVYARGYSAGLADFCQTETAYRLGRNEETYGYICPADLETKFVTAYVEGLNETLAELQLQENFLESRLWHATVRNRTFEGSYEVEGNAVPGGVDSGGRTVVLIEPRILGSLRNQLDNYRDRRARIRSALARADIFFKSVLAEPAGS